MFTQTTKKKKFLIDPLLNTEKITNNKKENTWLMRNMIVTIEICIKEHSIFSSGWFYSYTSGAIC